MIMVHLVEQAHPMIKVAWTIVICLYKVSFSLSMSISDQYWSIFERVRDSQASKAQQELDAEARQLAEEIAVMLAYVSACKDIKPVEGRDDIVLRAVELTQEGACLIDACMAHRFEGGCYISLLEPT